MHRSSQRDNCFIFSRHSLRSAFFLLHDERRIIVSGMRSRANGLKSSDRCEATRSVVHRSSQRDNCFIFSRHSLRSAFFLLHDERRIIVSGMRSRANGLKSSDRCEATRSVVHRSSQRDNCFIFSRHSLRSAFFLLHDERRIIVSGMRSRANGLKSSDRCEATRSVVHRSSQRDNCFIFSRHSLRSAFFFCTTSAMRAK